jgi:integrase
MSFYLLVDCLLGNFCPDTDMKKGIFRKVISPVTGACLSIEAYAGRIHGRKQRRRFKISEFGTFEYAQSAAKAWVRDVQQDTTAHQETFFALTPYQRDRFVQVTQLLEPYNIDVLDAIRLYVLPTLDKRPAEPWTFREAANGILQFKRAARKSPYSLKTLKDILRVACLAFGKRPCDDIKIEDLEQFLRWREHLPDKRKHKAKAFSSATIRNYRQSLSMAFSFAIERGHASSNPALKLAVPARENEPVHIFTVEEAKRLLEAAELRFLPDLLLGLFAGLRPMREALHLESQTINFPKRYIEVTAKRSKTRQRRFVQMTENLAMWLEPLKYLLNERLHYHQCRVARVRACAAAGLRWHQDILRHSFASYHLALHENAAKTSLELGHRSADMLFEHYRELVTNEDAKAYFSIIPAACNLSRPEVKSVYATSIAALPPSKIVAI